VIPDDLLIDDDVLALERSAIDDALYDDVWAFFEANAGWSGSAAQLVDEQAAALVLQEARALDARAYEHWLSLYGLRSIYWIPLNDQVGDPRSEPAIHFDDHRRLADRVALIRTGFLHAQTPPSNTTRVVSNLESRVSDDRIADIHSCLVIHEQRLGYRQTYAGRQVHRLERVGDGWAIRYRIVMLVDRDVSQGNTTFIL
jgi:3-phenylpropionate/cinnamic acid dioxygenase small subunit